jgi:hypothetical protein
MGEFLLSLLTFDHDGTVVFTKHLKGSRYKAGDAVPFVYPNQDRKTKRFYYRILEKFYEPNLIIELLKTQDPNLIDNDGFIPYQRILRGKDMYNLTLNHHSFEEIAVQYGWNKHAVEYAISQYRKWQAKEDERAHLEAEDALIDDEPKLSPEQLTAEQIAKREALLAQWE